MLLLAFISLNSQKTVILHKLGLSSSSQSRACGPFSFPLKT